MDNQYADIIPLDLPVRDGSNGYANLFLRYYNILAQVIADSRGNEAFRINLLINLMINSIPDDDFRDKLKELKTKLTEEKTNGQSLDLVEKENMVLDVNMDLIGEISGFFDLYMGTSKRIGVSIEAVYPEKFYLEDEKSA